MKKRNTTRNLFDDESGLRYFHNTYWCRLYLGSDRPKIIADFVEPIIFRNYGNKGS